VFNNPGVVAARQTLYLDVSDLILGTVVTGVGLEGTFEINDVLIATAASIADLVWTGGNLYANDVGMQVAVSPADAVLTGGLLQVSDVDVATAVTSADATWTGGDLYAVSFALDMTIDPATIVWTGGDLYANDVAVQLMSTAVGIAGVLETNNVALALAVTSAALSYPLLTVSDVAVAVAATSADAILTAGDLTVQDVAVAVAATSADAVLTAGDLTVQDVVVAGVATSATLETLVGDLTVNDVTVATSASSAALFVFALQVNDVTVGPEPTSVGAYNADVPSLHHLNNTLGLSAIDPANDWVFSGTNLTEVTTGQHGLAASVIGNPVPYANLLGGGVSPSTEDVTIEGFLKLTDYTSTSTEFVLEAYDSADFGGTLGWRFYIYRFSGRIYFYQAVYHPGGTHLSYRFITDPGATYGPIHFATVFNVTAGKIEMFIDGVRSTNGEVLSPGTARDMLRLTTTLTTVDTTCRRFLDEVRVSRAALYTGSTYTVPTAEFEPIDDTLPVFADVTLSPTVTSSDLFLTYGLQVNDVTVGPQPTPVTPYPHVFPVNDVTLQVNSSNVWINDDGDVAYGSLPTGATPDTISSLYAWWDFSDMSTVYQDTAGTTPVVGSGQIARRVNDKSGNNRYVTQSGSTLRWYSNLQNSLGGVFGNGTTFGMNLNNLNAGLPNSEYRWVCIFVGDLNDTYLPTMNTMFSVRRIIASTGYNTRWPTYGVIPAFRVGDFYYPAPNSGGSSDIDVADDTYFIMASQGVMSSNDGVRRLPKWWLADGSQVLRRSAAFATTGSDLGAGEIVAYVGGVTKLEIAVFTNPTDAEVLSVINYLQAKWNL